MFALDYFSFMFLNYIGFCCIWGKGAFKVPVLSHSGEIRRAQYKMGIVKKKGIVESSTDECRTLYMSTSQPVKKAWVFESCIAFP